MIDSVVFIGALIVAITQAIKYVALAVSGAITIIVAMVVGLFVAVFAHALGVDPITPAQGILTGLASAGVHTVASTISTPKK